MRWNVTGRVMLAMSALWTLSVSPLSAEEASAKVRLLVPAYFYPAGEGLQEWERLIESSTTAPIVAIVNPGSGPGKRVDRNYTRVFDLAKDRPITLVGYVTLSYAQRPLSTVKADIDSWLYFYPQIRGIFFDEQPSGDEQVSFANECFAYAKKTIKDALIVSNPGTVCAPGYATGVPGTVICLFEHHRGFDKYQPPAWSQPLASSQFAVLLYGVASESEMQKALDAAVRKRTGYLYITDSPASMPWGRLPHYWQQELEHVRKLNHQ